MGSKKRFLGVLVFAGVAAAGCVNNDASANQAQEAMENAGLEEEVAACIGTALEDRLDQDQLNAVAGADDLADLEDESVPGTEASLREVTLEILQNCQEDPGSGGSSEGGEPSTTEPAEGSEGENGDDSAG